MYVDDGGNEVSELGVRNLLELVVLLIVPTTNHAPFTFGVISDLSIP